MTKHLEPSTTTLTSDTGPAAPLPPVLPYQSPQPRSWRAGTLDYTGGGLVLLFFWLLSGDFCWQFRERALAPAMPLLLRKFGGSDLANGVLIGFLPWAIALIVAPIVSYRSDRYRSRWGRRVPFLLLVTPPAFFSMMGLALAPVIGGRVDHMLGALSPGHTFCVLGTFTFFWIMFDVAVVVTNSVHPALVNDVVPRDVIGTFFGLFRMISLGAGMLFNFYFLGMMEQHYVAIFLVIGVVYLIAFMVMCLMVKEGEYPPPPPPVEGGALGRFFGALANYFGDCFTKPYYLWFFLSFLLAHMSFAAINLFSLYFAQSVGMSMATYGKFSAIQLGCSLIQAPLIGWLADKFHPLRLTIVALALYALTTGLSFVYARDARTFAAAHVIAGTCSGFWLTATAPLAPSLLPKLKFATFASVLVIAQAVGQMITAPVIGAILEHLNKGKPPIARDYHPIYLWACVFITLSLLVTLVVHKYFVAYGGKLGYVPPE